MAHDREIYYPQTRKSPIYDPVRGAQPLPRTCYYSIYTRRGRRGAPRSSSSQRHSTTHSTTHSSSTHSITHSTTHTITPRAHRVSRSLPACPYSVSDVAVLELVPQRAVPFPVAVEPRPGSLARLELHCHVAAPPHQLEVHGAGLRPFRSLPFPLPLPFPLSPASCCTVPPRSLSRRGPAAPPHTPGRPRHPPWPGEPQHTARKARRREAGGRGACPLVPSLVGKQTLCPIRFPSDSASGIGRRPLNEACDP